MSILNYFTITTFKKYRRSFYIVREYDEDMIMTNKDKIIFIFIIISILLLIFKSEIINYLLLNIQYFQNLFFQKYNNIIKNIDDGKNTDSINNIKDIFSLLDN